MVAFYLKQKADHWDNDPTTNALQQSWTPENIHFPSLERIQAIVCHVIPPDSFFFFFIKTSAVLIESPFPIGSVFHPQPRTAGHKTVYLRSLREAAARVRLG